MLPNVIIVGAPKAGTTSTSRWLTEHPDVAGPTVKETEYFVDKSSHAYNRTANFHHQGMNGYEQFFETASARRARILIEAGPDYMYQETALAQLPSLPTNPLFLFVLREPAAQIYSLFHYLQNNWQYLPKSMTFSEFVELARKRSPTLQHHELLQNAIDNGRYIRHVEKWISRCGDDRVRVYLFDDLVRDSRGFMQRLCRDLEIDPTFYDAYNFPKDNETYRVRSQLLQTLNVSLRKKLPRGRMYAFARSIYRHLNTSSGKARKTAEELDALLALRREFVEDNRALATRFNLDLNAWQ